MPTYVYECQSCHKTLEVEQRITEEPLKDCPCGQRDSLIRLIQPTAVMFKGGGFYVNDAQPQAAAPPAECSGEPSSCPSCAPSPTSD